jgi:molecular chaperone GrpE (heat shock protein)
MSKKKENEEKMKQEEVKEAPLETEETQETPVEEVVEEVIETDPIADLQKQVEELNKELAAAKK